MKSMTGFGRSETETDIGLLAVEIQSVNRKYLEISISLPKDFFRFEVEMRKLISSIITRGYVTARYSLFPFTKNNTPVINSALLQSLAKDCKSLAKEISCDPKEVTFPFLFNEIKNLPIQDEKTITFMNKTFHAATKAALNNLLNMREEEGKALATELEKRVKIIEAHLQSIQKKIPTTIEQQKVKIEKKLQEWSSLEYDERLMREVSFFADKMDITEEIIRMSSHTKQCYKYFQEDFCGRKLEFLLQEMQRESTTMKAKAVDVEIIEIIIEVQSELEKMREQVQNVE